MAKFTYQVDRVHNVVAPVTFNTSVELKGESVTLQPGETVVYKGVIELGGQGRYTFQHGDRKLFSPDRAALDAGLEENYDELVKP
ncbi:hypothetical protein D3C78_1467720 [compost metagenome]